MVNISRTVVDQVDRVSSRNAPKYYINSYNNYTISFSINRLSFFDSDDGVRKLSMISTSSNHGIGATVLDFNCEKHEFENNINTKYEYLRL